jgi:hypothetical protein
MKDETLTCPCNTPIVPASFTWTIGQLEVSPEFLPPAIKFNGELFVRWYVTCPECGQRMPFIDAGYDNPCCYAAREKRRIEIAEQERMHAAIESGEAVKV